MLLPSLLHRHEAVGDMNHQPSVCCLAGEPMPRPKSTVSLQHVNGLVLSTILLWHESSFETISLTLFDVHQSTAIYIIFLGTTTTYYKLGTIVL